MIRVSFIFARNLVTLCLVAATLAPAQPKLAVDKMNIDLGVIYNGAVKKARISVRNAGTDTLRILGVQTSCGCTAAKQPKSALRPGESDVVEVEFNSTGFRGKIHKTVTIQTNDPKSPAVNVAIIGDVVDELVPLQGASAVWLGSLQTGKEVEHRVGFKNVSGKTITLRGFKSTSPTITVQMDQKTVQPADSIFVVIKITPLKTDYASEQITLETDSNKQTHVPMRVTFTGIKPS